MLVFISYIGNKLNLTNIAIPLNNIFISIQATHNLLDGIHRAGVQT